MLEEKVMSVPADAGDGMEERREEMTQTTFLGEICDKLWGLEASGSEGMPGLQVSGV